jgi:hypothetical protein
VAEQRREITSWQKVLGVVIAFLAVGVAWKIYGWVQPPRATKNTTDKSFPNLVFDNRFVLTMTRFVVLLAGIYVVISVVALMRQGRWLVQIGPAAAAQQVNTVVDDRETLRNELEVAKGRNAELETALKAAVAELEKVLATLATPAPEEK